jgi:hypothetical protein
MPRCEQRCSKINRVQRCEHRCIDVGESEGSISAVQGLNSARLSSVKSGGVQRLRSGRVQQPQRYGRHIACCTHNIGIPAMQGLRNARAQQCGGRKSEKTQESEGPASTAFREEDGLLILPTHKSIGRRLMAAHRTQSTLASTARNTQRHAAYSREKGAQHRPFQRAQHTTNRRSQSGHRRSMSNGDQVTMLPIVCTRPSGLAHDWGNTGSFVASGLIRTVLVIIKQAVLHGQLVPGLCRIAGDKRPCGRFLERAGAGPCVLDPEFAAFVASIVCVA